jgi:trans-2,3-dihydro-3-hydroxyanthranilate isomerase
MMVLYFDTEREAPSVMRHYNFFQLDVFTDKAFSGNPLAVFPEGEGLDDELMQHIAREMNLSETVFVLPSQDERALKRLRIFTPAQELPFAGHPVVGTWNMLAREGVVPLPAGGSGWTRIHQEVGIGVLPVDIEFREGQPLRVVMTQGRFEAQALIDDADERDSIARALGLAPSDLDESLPIQAVSTGNSMLVVPVRSLEALGRCRPESAAINAAYHRAGATGCYAFTREAMDGNSSEAHARFFVPHLGIQEDPATGSAAGPLAAYLVHYGALRVEAAPEDNIFRFVIEQGDFMGRPSRIQAEVKGTRGAVEEVRIGGPSIVVARGELMF